MLETGTVRPLDLGHPRGGASHPSSAGGLDGLPASPFRLVDLAPLLVTDDDDCSLPLATTMSMHAGRRRLFPSPTVRP